MNKGIVYLVQPAELIESPVYKIGCSKEATLDRCCNGYKKGTRYICIMECNDPLIVERKLKGSFKQKFKLHAGAEYFKGNESDMIVEFFNIVNQSNYTGNNSLENTRDIDNQTMMCKYCNKTFTRKNNLNNHIKNVCKERVNKEQPIENDYKKEIEIIKEKIEKLKKRKSTKTTDNYNKVINNGIISNNKVSNIREPGKENIEDLTNSEIEYVKSRGLNSIVSLIEYINFNERLRQYHSFYTSAINDKHVNVIDINTKKVVKQQKKDLFERILCSNMDKLEELAHNDNEFSEVLNELRANVLLKKGKKDLINQMNLLSYNKRHLVIDTWNASSSLDM